MVLEIAATLSKCGRNVAGNDRNLLGCFYIMLKNSEMKALFYFYFTKFIKIIKKLLYFSPILYIFVKGHLNLNSREIYGIFNRIF